MSRVFYHFFKFIFYGVQVALVYVLVPHPLVLLDDSKVHKEANQNSAVRTKAREPAGTEGTIIKTPRNAERQGRGGGQRDDLKGIL